MESWVIINFFISLSIGAIIGLEREVVHQKDGVKDFGGVRNFVLIALLGFFLSYFSLHVVENTSILIVGFLGFFVLIAAAYLVIGLRTKRYSTTSEVAALITFILACVVGSTSEGFYRILAIIATIIVASLLAFKTKLHSFASQVKMEEFFAAIKMALISVVILPLLPNKNYTLLDIGFFNKLFIEGSRAYEFFMQLNVFNPFKIWLMVVFITGISFIGYFLVKVVGKKKGLGLTGILGGFVSSTAVTVSMSKKSKKQRGVDGFALAILLASVMMFVRVLIEILVVNRSLISGIVLPMGIMALLGFAISGWIFIGKRKERGDQKVNLKNPFEFNTALKFGLFFLLILILSKAVFLLFGDVGIYFVSVLSGLADVDAITLTLSSMALEGVISQRVAILAITLAAATNTLVKAGIVWMIGEKKLGRMIAWIFGVILVVGIGVALIF